MSEKVTRDRVHIIVTCANRKRYPVPEMLRLGTIEERRAGQRFSTWVRRLENAPSLAPAREMYAGEHWLVAATLATSGWSGARLWVCSAGYGLIGADTPIAPYSATFSRDAVDAVGLSRSEVHDWWRRLGDWRGPTPNAPRTIADLARQSPNAFIVAVLSEAYLRACLDDLIMAAGLLDGDRLTIIGPATESDITALQVPVTSALQQVVGGSLQALNARFALSLLSRANRLGCSPALSVLRRLADDVQGAIVKQGRTRSGQRLSDEDVRSYIEAELRSRPASATALLRRLRYTGRSCEQSRFRRIFLDTAEGGS